MARVVPGIHSVRETLKVRPKKITELWLRDGDLHGELEVFFEEAKKNRIYVKRVAQRTLDHQVASHQGVIAMVDGGPEWPMARELERTESGFILAIDSIEDPHNVGSLARSAWNLGGCLGILSSKDRSAGLTAAAEKVASGGFEHIPFQEVPNLAAELKSLKDLGFWIYGLEALAEQTILTTDFAKKAVIVVGSEESGLRKPVTGACDALLSIPQASGASSLNAAIAGAIVGYEFRRQRYLSENLKNSRKKL
jgi:23S rRNA (guanosine2251-2'-O)-methyltransferase